MKKLLFAMLCCLMGIVAYGQEVDFTTYKQLIKRGKGIIVCQKDEYRMIIGSLKKPIMSMLIGTSPVTAVGCLDNIIRKGKDELLINRIETVGLGGIRFFLTASGPSENRLFSFSGLNDPVKFKLCEQDIIVMKAAILESGNRLFSSYRLAPLQS